MIAKSVKSMKSADVDFADFDADFADISIKLVKLTISFPSTVRIQGGKHQFFLKFCKIHNSINLHQNPWILPKSTDFHISLSTFKRTTCETERPILPKKVTPIFRTDGAISLCKIYFGSSLPAIRLAIEADILKWISRY